MSDLLFRFLHAADFQLDTPLHGVAEVPDAISRWMIDAPYVAAERVFDAAIQEQVKLVVLSGNLLDLVAPHPRAICFVRDQLARLAGHGVTVCWAGGVRDGGGQWPASIALPPSVHHFHAAAVDTLALEKELKFPLTVVGRSGGESAAIRASDFFVEARESFLVAVTCGEADGAALAMQPIDYWALGGRNERKTLAAEPHTVHYPGTPQGRRPVAVGPHGCTIVDILASRQVRLRFVSCEAARWQHERVLVSSGAAWEDLEQKLAERMQDLRAQQPSGPLLTRWTLVATDVAEDPAVWRELRERTDKWLRKQAASQSDPCWPLAVDVEIPDRITAASYKEDTLLGDYLRAIRQLQDTPRPADLSAVSALGAGAPEMQWVADLSDPAVRAQVLQEAAEMGAALLRGEKTV